MNESVVLLFIMCISTPGVKFDIRILLRIILDLACSCQVSVNIQIILSLIYLYHFIKVIQEKSIFSLNDYQKQNNIISEVKLSPQNQFIMILH